MTDRPRLSASQTTFLKRLSRHGVAFKGTRGWRLKGDLSSTPFATGNRLIELRLAQELSAAGMARLVLTPAGRQTVQAFAARKQRRAAA